MQMASGSSYKKGCYSIAALTSWLLPGLQRLDLKYKYRR